MAAVQHITYKWFVVMWIVIGLLAAMLALSLASRISGSIPPVPETTEEAVYIVSPWPGVFCAGPYFGEPPYVLEGDEVRAGDVLCRIEAMRESEIRAPIDGKILQVLAIDGQMVDAGQPLMKIQPKQLEPL